jgi:hypothetical protein
VATDLFNQPAFWGASGAFIYAAPLFSTCAFTAKAAGGSRTRCGCEFVTAVAIGTLAAAAITPLIQEIFHRDTQAWMRAVSTMAGLLANRVSLKITDAAPDVVFEWLSRIFKGRDK